MRRVLLLVALALPSWGATLDQSFITGSGLGTAINECCKFVAQTYTAGLSGTLAGITIDVFSNTNFPLEVQVRSVAGGIPTSTILGDTTLSSSSSPLSSLITFSGLISQVAGNQYAIVLSYPTAPFVTGGAGQAAGTWSGAPGNLYAGGQSFLLLGSTWTAEPDFDSHFQTFVSAIPEPATGVLVLTAGCALALRRKILVSRRASK